MIHLPLACLRFWSRLYDHIFLFPEFAHDIRERRITAEESRNLMSVEVLQHMLKTPAWNRKFSGKTLGEKAAYIAVRSFPQDDNND